MDPFNEYSKSRSGWCLERVSGYHAIVEVQPSRLLSDWPPLAAGAFVHTLAIASGEQHFKELVVRVFDSEGFTVIGWAEIMPFDLSVNDWHSEYAQELHDYLCPEYPVQFSKFDTYPREGLDA